MAEEVSIFRIDFQGSDEIVEKIAAIRKEQERLKAENSALAKDVKDGNLEAAKAVEQNKIQIKSYGKEISSLTKTIETTNKANKSASGAYDQLSAQYALLKKQLNEMGVAEREQTERGRDMEAQSKRVYDEMKRLQELTGQHTLNVGNYTESIIKAADELGGFAMAGAQAGEEKIKLKTKLRELREEMQSMVLAGKDNTDEYKAMRKEAASYQEAIDGVNDELRTFADGERIFTTVAKSAQVMAEGFQLVTGAQALLGFESEKFEETMQKLVAIMAITNSLQSLANNLKKESAVRTAIAAGATKTATAAQWLWNAAMTANPIGLIIAGIAALAAGIYLLIKNFDSVTAAVRRAWNAIAFWKEAAERVETLAESQERLNRAFDISSDKLSFEIKMLKALGVSADDIAKKELELLELKAKHLTMNEWRMESDKNATTEQRKAASEAAKAAREELKIFEATEATRQRIEAEKAKEKAQSESQARTKKKQEEQERLDRELKYALKREQVAALELAVVQAKSDEDRLNARVEQVQRLAAIELESETLTQSERLLIVANAFNAESELRNEAVQKEIELERERQEVLAEDRARYDEKEKERQSAMQKFEQDITDARIDTAYALSDTMLTIAGEQSKIGRLAKAVQKGIALTEIGINLQRELAAIRVAAAVQNALLPGSGIITERIQSIKALAMAGAGTAKVLAMNTGGTVPGTGNTDTVPAMLTPGEGVLTKSAMTANDTFTVSGTPKQIASRLNTLYGGVEFRNRGGIIGSSQAAISTRAASEDRSREDFANAIRGLKIVTTVEDINNKMSSEAIRNELANYV